MTSISSEQSNHFDEDVYAAEEHIMEAMRAFFTRSNDYQNELEKQIGNFELTSCIIDNLFSEIEIIMQPPCVRIVVASD